LRTFFACKNELKIIVSVFHIQKEVLKKDSEKLNTHGRK
jgi:hypothetical protein